jgi:hypothetical protein
MCDRHQCAGWRLAYGWVHAFHCDIGCFCSCHFVPAPRRRVPLFYGGRHRENLHIRSGAGGRRRVPDGVHDTGAQRVCSLGATRGSPARELSSKT